MSFKIKIIQNWVQIISPCCQGLARYHVTRQRCSVAPAPKRYVEQKSSFPLIAWGSASKRYFPRLAKSWQADVFIRPKVSTAIGAKRYWQCWHTFPLRDEAASSAIAPALLLLPIIIITVLLLLPFILYRLNLRWIRLLKGVMKREMKSSSATVTENWKMNATTKKRNIFFQQKNIYSQNSTSLFIRVRRWIESYVPEL